MFRFYAKLKPVSDIEPNAIDLHPRSPPHRRYAVGLRGRQAGRPEGPQQPLPGVAHHQSVQQHAVRLPLRRHLRRHAADLTGRIVPDPDGRHRSGRQSERQRHPPADAAAALQVRLAGL